jgi:hypothetical protein
MTPLTPGTLVLGEDTYPSTPQDLLKLFAGNLFVPEQKLGFYKHNSAEMVPSDSLWYNTNNSALKVKPDGVGWLNVLGGNTVYRVRPDNNQIASNTRLFSKSSAPTATNGTEVCSVSITPRALANRFIVVAQVPAITTSGDNINVFGTLRAGNSAPFAMAATFCRAGNFSSLFVMGVHSPGPADLTNGVLNYALNIGTDDQIASIYYNRQSPTDAFGDFLTIQMTATEIPIG